MKKFPTDDPVNAPVKNGLTAAERARLVYLHIERMMERKAEADRNYAIALKLGPLLHKLTRKG